MLHHGGIKLLFVNSVLEENLVCQLNLLNHDFHHVVHWWSTTTAQHGFFHSLGHHFFHLIHLLFLGKQENFLSLLSGKLGG
jgi:hypothetical protein